MSYNVVDRREIMSELRGDPRVGMFEFEVLRAVMDGPNAYGVTIRDRLKQQTGREVSFGAVYTTLERLEEKGCLRSWWGESTAVRGGRRKRFYEATNVGRSAAAALEARFLSSGPVFAGA
jgi:DNA-binding PadR family transcriptional regulator